MQKFARDGIDVQLKQKIKRVEKDAVVIENPHGGEERDECRHGGLVDGYHDESFDRGVERGREGGEDGQSFDG